MAAVRTNRPPGRPRLPESVKLKTRIRRLTRLLAAAQIKAKAAVAAENRAA
jgi:hypothetical protein